MAQPQSVIPERFAIYYCSRCGSDMRPRQSTDDWNQYVCRSEPPHSFWIQSPPVAYIIPVDQNRNTYLVRRGIPPAIGGLCFPGGYIDWGDTAEQTIVHETLDEACIRIDAKNDQKIYLGQWFESGPGVTATAFLVRIRTTQVEEFVPNKEATERIKVNIWDLDPEILAFNGNRLAFTAALNRLSCRNV